MIQYTQVADPTESAARRERMRLAEEKMEESALRIATKASLRETHNAERVITPETERSMERIPISLRLGPSLEQRRTGETDKAGKDLTPETEQTEERVPAPLRIGTTKRAEQVGISGKRKPGRPPGTRKVQQSPKQLVGSSSRKRKIQQTKPTSVRRKLNAKEGKEKKQNVRTRTSSSRDAGNSENSDNQPICNMIPATSKRRMDFRNPSPLGP